MSYYGWRMNSEQDSTSPTTSVGELEASVLTALWERGPSSTPEVYEEVGKPRGLAYTTILTVLQRLFAKGLLERQSRGKTHVYEAALSREEFSERRAELLAGAVVELGGAGLSAFLVEADRLDPAFVDELRSRLK